VRKYFEHFAASVILFTLHKILFYSQKLQWSSCADSREWQGSEKRAAAAIYLFLL